MKTLFNNLEYAVIEGLKIPHILVILFGRIVRGLFCFL